MARRVRFWDLAARFRSGVLALVNGIGGLVATEAERDEISRIIILADPIRFNVVNVKPELCTPAATAMLALVMISLADGF
jgi:hypothetical protein